MDERASEVLAFWFGELRSGRADATHTQRWWAKDPAFDADVVRRFGGLSAELLAGEHRDWDEEPLGLLARVIALDQFPRNMFRGTRAMFVGDPAALTAAFEGLALGYERRLETDQRVFLYLPLMHSERLAVQERCVELFDALVTELQGGGEQQREAARAVTMNADFARQHRDIIARFGRFPHRNQALGRTSTADEAEFLKQPGSSF